MTDDRVATWVETDELGWLPFQEYFVKHHFALKSKSFVFKGIEQANPSTPVLQAIEQADAVVICPSNPFVSIDPILALSGLRGFNRIQNSFCVYLPLLAAMLSKAH